MFYTTEDLLASVKRRVLINSSPLTFPDSDILLYANEELQLTMFSDLLSVREDLFLTLKRQAITANQSLYPVPERAGANSLKNVVYVDASGNKRTLPRGTIEDEVDFGGTASEPERFLLRGDEIQLMPRPTSSSGSLEIWYHARPSELTETTNCARIDEVTSEGGVTTLGVSTDMSSVWSTGDEIDILNAQSPFLLWGEGVVITGITSSTVTVATADLEDEAGNVPVGIGDYICPAQKTNIPMIPQEFHPLLAQMVAVKLVEANGDLQQVQVHQAKLTEMRRLAFQMVANRVESQLKRVIKRSGILSHSGYGRLSPY